MIPEVQPSDPRVLRAKAANKIGSSAAKTFFGVIAFVGVILGIILLIGQVSFGWLCFIPTVLVIMFHEWWRHDLMNIPPVLNSDKPTDILSSDILTVWATPNMSHETSIDTLSNAKGFWFMGNRVGFVPEVLKQTDSTPDIWWPKTIELWRQYPTDDGIAAAHITTAMVLTSSNKQALFSVANCNEEDVMAALSWFAYVQELSSNLLSKRASGGIARDWAAGYTPLLDTYSQNISRAVQYGSTAQRKIIGHQNVIDQLQIIFSGNGRANCALVGETGAGKNVCIQAFAESVLEKTAPAKIRYAQVYQIDLASVLTKVPADKIEQTIQRLCVEAYSAKNIILFFDNAGAFFGMGGSADITNIIMPIIEGGRVRMIFSFTQTQWQYVQRTKSGLVALLNYQAVTPTNQQDTLKILENQALFTESQYNCTFTYRGLKEVYRLADRYGPEIVMPGRAVSVLEDVARNNQGTLVTNVGVQQSIEKTTGIKIATADASERSTLLTLEAELHKRVIGQHAAVREIVSALKRSRTGVGNPNKPIGTFLFLGPTGVGKTEMSKSLASTYFGGASGMVRVDMNEYITQDSIHRLLSSGSDAGTSFLDTVRKQPFSVILFDEIEKAHPDIVNVLLQLLDEGVIRDNDNRTVSFKDAIIIATSNAGSDIIREQISNGANIDELAKHLADDLIQRGTFKPEFINRFDDVIIFSPLTQDELLQVVGVMLGGINTQLANQGITVALTEDAKRWLVEQGYDERLGARPLRRMMQKTVESAVSNILLQQEVQNGSTITLDGASLAATMQ